jgi:hypothetical protein
MQASQLTSECICCVIVCFGFLLVTDGWPEIVVSLEAAADAMVQPACEIFVLKCSTIHSTPGVWEHLTMINVPGKRVSQASEWVKTRA